MTKSTSTGTHQDEVLNISYFHADILPQATLPNWMWFGRWRVIAIELSSSMAQLPVEPEVCCRFYSLIAQEFRSNTSSNRGVEFIYNKKEERKPGWNPSVILANQKTEPWRKLLLSSTQTSFGFKLQFFPLNLRVDTLYKVPVKPSIWNHPFTYKPQLCIKPQSLPM